MSVFHKFAFSLSLSWHSNKSTEVEVSHLVECGHVLASLRQKFPHLIICQVELVAIKRIIIGGKKEEETKTKMGKEKEK